MTHNELNAYIYHYLTEDKTHSAIMLTAPWGTGKSYYIQNELIPFLEKPENGGHKCIVVSLYGLTSILEISQSIYLELRTKRLKKWWTQHVSSRFSKKVRSVSREVVYYGKSGSSTIIKGLAGKIGFKLDVSDKDLSMIYNSIDFTDKLLILEDLERTSISIDEVLGYVNNLVEQDGVKVLLVANEEKILQYKSINEDNAKKNEEEKPVDKNGKDVDKNSKDKEKKYSKVSEKYIQIKEKTISDTIRFESSLSSALKEIIDSFHDVYLDRFASDAEQTALYDFCVENEIINLRTFVFACQKTVDIFQAINLNADEDADFIKTVFYSIVAFSQRLKTGENTVWKEGESFSIELSAEKYPLFRFCYDYITTQTFNISDVEDSKEILKKLRYYDKKRSSGDKDLKVLSSWRTSTEKEVIQALNSISERLKNKDDISPYEYGRIAYHLAAIKCDLKYDVEKIEQLLIANLYNRENELEQNYIFVVFLRTKKERPEIVDEYGKLKEKMINSLVAKDTTIFGFDYQPSSISAFVKQIREKPYMVFNNGALASRLNMDSVYEMLLHCSSAEIQEFRFIFVNMYKDEKISEVLVDDKEALLVLSEKLESLKENTDFDKIQKLQIEYFLENIKDALTRYEKNPECMEDT